MEGLPPQARRVESGMVCSLVVSFLHWIESQQRPMPPLRCGTGILPASRQGLEPALPIRRGTGFAILIPGDGRSNPINGIFENEEDFPVKASVRVLGATVKTVHRFVRNVANCQCGHSHSSPFSFIIVSIIHYFGKPRQLQARQIPRDRHNHVAEPGGCKATGVPCVSARTFPPSSRRTRR